MAKVGRPPTPEDEQLVTAVRLMNKHVAMLDRVIRERSQRDLRSVVTGPEQEIPGTNMTVADCHIAGINYASERRKLVAALIEQALGTEALYPTSVRPDVPPGTYSDMELEGISGWAKQRDPAPDRKRAASRSARARAQQATPNGTRIVAGGVPPMASDRNPSCARGGSWHRSEGRVEPGGSRGGDDG